MIKNSLILTLLICVLASCTDGKKPKIVYDNSGKNKETTELKKDTTLIETADLPIRMDSTDYLIHPIGFLKISKSWSKTSYRSSDYKNTNFSVSNQSKYEITGNLTNLKFQHIDSEKLIPLTEKTINIQSVTFIKEVFDRTKSKYLLYKVIDKDTNLDQVLDYQDLKSLYISKIDGSSFTKITPEYQELVSWKILASKNKLYFKTVEDINKDGEFDKTDIIHYHYLDLENKMWDAKEYNPL